MALLTIIKSRSRWNFLLYGVVVFPQGTDISGIGGRIGKYYRITTLDRLVSALDTIDAEARRDSAHTKRPLPRQIEDLLRGTH